MRSLTGWDWPSLAGRGERTATVADKHTRKVIGEPSRGEPDVRFDEGTGGIADTWASTETLHGHSEVVAYTMTT